MARKTPSFDPVTRTELRALWKLHDDPDIRRLVLEAVRYREVIKEIDDLYKTTHQAWRDQVGGNLVALHLLQKVLDAEQQRLS